MQDLSKAITAKSGTMERHFAQQLMLSLSYYIVNISITIKSVNNIAFNKHIVQYKIHSLNTKTESCVLSLFIIELKSGLFRMMTSTLLYTTV